MIIKPPKEEIIQAFIENYGRIGDTADALFVSRATLHKWTRNEPDIIKAIKEIKRKNKSKPVHLESQPYDIPDNERLMILKHVETPDGTGILSDAYRNWFEVEIGKEIKFYPKSQVRVIQNPHIPNLTKSKNFEDIWHNASLLEAADTRAKRDFITGRMSLENYMNHERKIYGTINA